MVDMHASTIEHPHVSKVSAKIVNRQNKNNTDCKPIHNSRENRHYTSYNAHIRTQYQNRKCCICGGDYPHKSNWKDRPSSIATNKIIWKRFAKGNNNEYHQKKPTEYSQNTINEVSLSNTEQNQSEESHEDKIAEQYVHFVTAQAISKAMNVDEVKNPTSNDRNDGSYWTCMHRKMIWDQNYCARAIRIAHEEHYGITSWHA